VAESFRNKHFLHIFGAEIFFACFFIFLARPASGQEYLPLKDVKLLPGPVHSEPALKNSGVRVVVANYTAIREDVEFLRHASTAEIDQWLVDNALISQAQAAQTEFNTLITTAPYKGQALRPKKYGRAMVAVTPEGILIDEKGAGSDNPRYDWQAPDPRNGNFMLAEALREFYWTSAIEMVTEHAKIQVTNLQGETHTLRPVKAYAVLWSGFDVIQRNMQKQDLGHDPAGYLYRQPHTRFENPTAEGIADQGVYYEWDERVGKQVELALRKYGITSEGAGRTGDQLKGGINIQGTKEIVGMMDFGNYVVLNQFPEHNVFSFEGDQVLIAPGPQFVQPDPAVSLPASVWGPYREGHIEAREDKPAIWAYDTAKYVAQMFREGNFEAGRIAAENYGKTLLNPIHEKLKIPIPFEIEHTKDVWRPPTESVQIPILSCSRLLIGF
jgi:hypothetical protein